MPTKVLSIYKIQLLLSLTLSIVLIALRVEKNALNIAQIFLGAFAGTFLLDLDYFIHAYFLDPTADFSKTLVSYVKHMDIKSAFAFIHYHRHDIKEKTLNSALFQIAIGAGAIFAVSSNASLFVKSLVISAYINSIYRLAELYLVLDPQKKPNRQCVVYVFCSINRVIYLHHLIFLKQICTESLFLLEF